MRTGVKVPITLVMYGYTKHLRHNMNTINTSTAATGLKMDAKLLLLLFLS